MGQVGNVVKENEPNSGGIVWPDTPDWYAEKLVSQFTNLTSKYQWIEEITDTTLFDGDAILVSVYWFDGSSDLYPHCALSRVINLNDMRNKDTGRGVEEREFTFLTLSKLTAVLMSALRIHEWQAVQSVYKTFMEIDLTPDAYNIDPAINQGKIGVYIYKLD